MKRPSFQFYPGDWLSSQRVALMSLDEEGAYIRALSFCWNHGSIPSDPEKLARLIGKGASTTLATTLATMFEPDSNDPSKLVHARLNAERAKQDEWSRKSSEGGRKSAELRQNHNGASTTLATTLETVVEKWHQPNGNSSSASSSSSPSSLSSPIPSLTPKPKRRPDGLRDEEMERAMVVGGIFGRRPGTAWCEKEVVQFRKYVMPMPQEDLDLLVWYYEQPGLEFRRQELKTLLNNLPGELDKARAHKNRPPSLFDGANGTNTANGHGGAAKPNGELSANMQAMLWTKELEEVEKKASDIDHTYSGLQTWCEFDRAKFKAFKARAKELKIKLGRQV